MPKPKSKNNSPLGKDIGRNDANIFAAYAFADITDKIFTIGLLSVGVNNVDNSEFRQASDGTKAVAKAKYKSYAYSGKILLGRRCQIDSVTNTIISPMMGFRTSNFKDNAYDETGAGSQNMKVAKKSSSLSEMIIGAKISRTYEDISGFNLKPELGLVSYINMHEKTAVSRLSNEAFNNPVAVKNLPSSKAWYSINTNLTASKGIMEYAASYEIQLDKKYLGQQAMLKLRVNL